MLKVRVIGRPNEITWFMKQLTRHSKMKISNVSERLPIINSNKYKRQLFEVENGFLVIPLLKAYDREAGSKSKINKWFFYVFYPVHLFLIWMIICASNCV